MSVGWVHDQIFAAGGSHIPSRWASFSDQTKIGSVLHLDPDGPQPFLGPPPRAFLWMAVGSEEAADPPTRLLAARFLAERLEHGDSLLIHGTEGRHRTRWAYVAYLIWSGRRVKSALRQAEELPWQAPYRTDSEAWWAFAEWLEGRPQEAPGRD